MLDPIADLLRRAARRPVKTPEPNAIWLAGRRSRTRRIAAVVVAAVIVPALVVIGAVDGLRPLKTIEFAPADPGPSESVPVRPTPSPTPSESASRRCEQGPRLKLLKKSGPPGLRIGFRGTCFVGPWGTERKALGAYGLFLIGTIDASDRSRGAPDAPCEIIGGKSSLHIGRRGKAEGTITVPSRGHCFQEDRGERFLPGGYTLGLGCHTCHTDVTFTITRPIPVPTLPELPTQGLLVEGRDEVGVVNMDGTRIARLPDFNLDHVWEPGRPPVLTDADGLFYRLDVANHRLVRGTSSPADQAAYNKRVTLPATPRYDGKRALGRWRWTVPSPDGSQILAQWSSECEVPTAFVLNAEGRDPQPVVGDTYAKAPNSFALGWTGDGRPVVHLPEAACGRGHPVPGIYAAGEELTLLVRTPPWASVQMWGVGG